MSKRLRIGSHLVSPRTGYTHHGIYVGKGKVIHYSGLADGLDSGPVEETNLETFAAGNGYSVIVYKNAFPTKRIISRARGRLGENSYSVFNNNCEHFCLWCIVGKHKSPQVDKVCWVGAPSLGTVVGLGARGLVAASGSVAGLSGAGVMSGLASTGAMVGGGAVAGIGILGAAPAIAAASLLNDTVLADNPTLGKKERKAMKKGRVGSYVGAGVGTAGSIAAISASGTVAGLSGAGITSGLAAIGSTVGGGMAAGVAISTAAPVAAAVALGYGVYKLASWWDD